MWTQSLDVLFATCLVGVSGGWLLVFHSFCEMRVMSESVLIWNWTEWPFSFTDLYFHCVLVLGRKVGTRLFVCIFLCHLCLLCGHLCYFMLWWGEECLFMSLLFTLATAVRHEWILSSEMTAMTIPAHRGVLYVKLGNVRFCCFWTALTVCLVANTNCYTICESCLKFTNCWHSTATYCK